MTRFLFKFKKPMMATDLPVQLELNTFQQKNKLERKEYVQVYKHKIGLKGKWYVSEKLRGPRTLWSGNQLLDKTLRVLDAPKWFIKELPPNIPLDGVLQGYRGPVEKEVDWKKVKFVVFDMPVSGLPFETRLNRLKRLHNITSSSVIKIHNLTLFTNIETEFPKVNDLYTESISNGGNGVMLIEANSLYQGKKNNKLLSYKREIFGVAKITGYREGMNRYYTYLGKFQCETEHGKTFYCSHDIPDEIRKKYHFDRTQLRSITNPETVPVIGDTLIYTSDIMIKNGTVPRDPIFKDFEKAAS